MPTRHGFTGEHECRRCHVVRALSWFRYRPKGQRNTRTSGIQTAYAQWDWLCKQCARSRARERVVAYLREVKSATPCADCGARHPYWVMQFDHTGQDKSFTIATNVHRKSIGAIRAEVQKCDVVCANCHANRTYVRSKMVRAGN